LIIAAVVCGVGTAGFATGALSTTTSGLACGINLASASVLADAGAGALAVAGVLSSAATGGGGGGDVKAGGK
jgi:hypothetical protein